jgi:hypothetical protein
MRAGTVPHFIHAFWFRYTFSIFASMAFTTMGVIIALFTELATFPRIAFRKWAILEAVFPCPVVYGALNVAPWSTRAPFQVFWVIVGVSWVSTVVEGFACVVFRLAPQLAIVAGRSFVLHAFVVVIEASGVAFHLALFLDKGTW